VVALWVLPRVAGSWGHAGHQLIVVRAADVTPGPLGRLARADVGRLRERCLDPDREWRATCGEQERVQHFFDADAYAADPAAIERDLEALEAEHGADLVARNGLLPWRIDELASCLERALAAGELEQAVDLMGQLAHYTADLAQPFHLTRDYDGQSTNQRGIHRRYERELVAGYLDALTLALDAHPIDITPIHEPVAAAFAAMPGTAARVARILAADRAAARHSRESPAYRGEMWYRLQSSLTDQLVDAAALTAGVWLGAWERAGSPSLASTTEIE